MADPKITVMNKDNSQAVTEWHLGELKQLVETPVLEINVWNNKGGAADVPDLVNARITTVDINGGTDEEAVSNKWTYACVTSTAAADKDGNKTFTQIGGTTTAPVAADGATDTNLTNHVIKGTANDGTAANSKNNYSSMQLKVIPPANGTKNGHKWRVMLQGEFS